jgi:hypothetical protein
MLEELGNPPGFRYWKVDGARKPKNSGGDWQGHKGGEGSVVEGLLCGPYIGAGETYNMAGITGDEYWIYYFDEDASCYEASLQACPFSGAKGDVYIRACWGVIDYGVDCTGWCKVGSECHESTCVKYCCNQIVGGSACAGHDLNTHSGDYKVNMSAYSGSGVPYEYDEHYVELCTIK